MAMAAIATAHSTNCNRPKPNTRRRITRSRSSDSSRPIMNIIMLMPSSAIGCDRFRAVQRDGAEQRTADRPAVARPNGPTATPTSMNPSTGLSRSRWNSGITMAAAARMIRAGLNSPGSKCVSRRQYPSANRKPWNACETRPGVWIAAKCPELISRYSAPGICLAIGSTDPTAGATCRACSRSPAWGRRCGGVPRSPWNPPACD